LEGRPAFGPASLVCTPGSLIDEEVEVLPQL
jgi:hypothetical protein